MLGCWGLFGWLIFGLGAFFFFFVMITGRWRTGGAGVSFCRGTLHLKKQEEKKKKP